MDFKKVDLFEIIYSRLLGIAVFGLAILAMGVGVFLVYYTTLGSSIALVGILVVNFSTISSIIVKLIEN